MGQQKIKRQLLMYAPDIVCIQGLQSIGFMERCSDTASEWFNCDDKLNSNHLVQFYRQISEDYDVAFAPTMRLPGSKEVCFGNAIFWKHSHWQAHQRWTHNAAISVELRSRLQGPPVVV